MGICEEQKGDVLIVYYIQLCDSVQCNNVGGDDHDGPGEVNRIVVCTITVMRC